MSKKRIKRLPTFSEQLRTAVETCGLTRYRIAQLTNIDQGRLSRFVRGEANLSLRAFDELAKLLRIEIVMRGPEESTNGKGE